MSDLAVSCRISTPSGWLDVNDGVYRLGKDAFAAQSTTWRRQEAANPFVEGSWTVAAVRENVVEILSVWVRGTTATPAWQAVAALTEAVSQRNFAIEFTVDGVRRTYTCNMAEYQVQATTELRVAGMAQVIAQVPRSPVFDEETV